MMHLPCRIIIRDYFPYPPVTADFKGPTINYMPQLSNSITEWAFRSIILKSFTGAQ
jgi:hypothetical protein